MPTIFSDRDDNFRTFRRNREASRNHSAPILVPGTVKSQTEKAWLFSDGSRSEWVPKSQCRWDQARGIMEVPAWLHREKGFGTLPNHIAYQAAIILYNSLSAYRKVTGGEPGPEPGAGLLRAGATETIPDADLLMPLAQFSETHLVPAMAKIEREIGKDPVPIRFFKTKVASGGTWAGFGGVHLHMRSARNHLRAENLIRFETVYELTAVPEPRPRFRNLEFLE